MLPFYEVTSIRQKWLYTPLIYLFHNPVEVKRVPICKVY